MKKHLVKITIGISASLLTAYIGISVIAANILSTPQRIFDPKAVSVFSQPPSEVDFFTSDGVEIAGWFLSSKLNQKAIILVHGMNSSRTAEMGGRFPEFAAGLNREGFTILMIDLRGHGQSGNARFTFGITERRDVIAAVNWLKRRGYQPKAIGVLGVSMGASTAISATAEDSDIGALVTDSAYAEVYPVMQQNWSNVSGLPNIFLPSTMMFGSWLTGYDLTTSKPVNEIGSIVPRPVLIIHSKYDPFTPINQAYALKSANPLSIYWETSATNHAESYNTNPKAYIRKVSDFFSQNLN
ncbi:alpha/beta hydrolase [Pseudanabaena sp. ABRG5-3]|uniref:alpha/beta hydrolase n=1 Tax=Pseudanabaena sp. ABRG5-3 TaxID=685565 RepID=UPI000DC7295B|nr:alpha/beta fold hydrolase [Pseudanabaena sp. ABRG5-3]BBC26962.1 dipeptidyl aminopeptidase/acylaminoacyl-peptidase-like protein [Pseudanabaena sp. ABRG5-3]